MTRSLFGAHSMVPTVPTCGHWMTRKSPTGMAQQYLPSGKRLQKTMEYHHFQ